MSTLNTPHSAHYLNDTRDLWWNADFLELVATRTGLRRVQRALDVGAGLGHWTRTVASLLSPGARITGIEREATWVERAMGTVDHAANDVVIEVAHRDKPGGGKRPRVGREFDTVKELKAGLEDQIKKSKSYTQGLQARELLTEELLKLVDVPVSQELINADVERHLEGEGRQKDDAHRAEVIIESTKSFQVQMLLDAIAEKEEVRVNENELLQYLMQASQSYGMDPNEFVKAVDEQGQIPSFVAEVARRKALSVVLEAAKVTDSDGKAVDLAEFTKTDDGFTPENHEGHDHN